MLGPRRRDSLVDEEIGEGGIARDLDAVAAARTARDPTKAQRACLGTDRRHLRRRAGADAA